MTLEELEKQLPEIRESQGASLSWLASRGIAGPTVYKIHRGENYAIGSLFKYIESLHYVVKVDGVLVTDTVKLSGLLKAKRIALGLSLLDLEKELGWSPNQVISVEKGSNYYRSTLLKYIQVVNIDIKIVGIDTLTPEEQDEFFKS